MDSFLTLMLDEVPLSVFPFLFLSCVLILQIFLQITEYKNKYINKHIFSLSSLSSKMCVRSLVKAEKKKKTRESKENRHLSQILKKTLQYLLNVSCGISAYYQLARKGYIKVAKNRNHIKAMHTKRTQT